MDVTLCGGSWNQYCDYSTTLWPGSDIQRSAAHDLETQGDIVDADVRFVVGISKVIVCKAWTIVLNQNCSSLVCFAGTYDDVFCLVGLGYAVLYTVFHDWLERKRWYI